jgi:hypothetical protein
MPPNQGHDLKQFPLNKRPDKQKIRLTSERFDAVRKEGGRNMGVGAEFHGFIDFLSKFDDFRFVLPLSLIGLVGAGSMLICCLFRAAGEASDEYYKMLMRWQRNKKRYDDWKSRKLNKP